MTQRLLFSAPELCPFGCVYCFATRADYSPQAQLFASVPAGDEVSVVYPACDGELFLLSDFEERLERIDAAIRTVAVVSVSTKAALDAGRVRPLARLDGRLRSSGRGFVKAAVSFATADSIAELEPGTASFEERVATLKTFAEHGLATAVTLKPLLPFIPLQEYLSIIDACSAAAQSFLLGDLYVGDDAFFRRFIAGRYPSSERRISWLREHPVWTVIESVRLKDALRIHLRARGLSAFDSDVELVRELHATAAKR